MTHHEKATVPTSASSDKAVTVSRVFSASPQSAFGAFTDPAKMAQWWAPAPLTVPIAEADVRVGGRYHYVMRDPDGNDFSSTGAFVEIDEPRRLVFSDSVADMPSEWVDMVNEARGEAKGTLVPDGVVTVTFEDLGDSTTRVTFSEEFDSKATRDAYVEMQMVEGLNGSFDQLEKVLAGGA